jgi:hypothetical protein
MVRRKSSIKSYETDLFLGVTGKAATGAITLAAAAIKRKTGSI